MDASRSGLLSGKEVSARLKAADFRVTQPRLKVYAALQDLGRHRSADEVIDKLRKEGKPLPRQSVYNALSALDQAGLLFRADAGPGRSLFETNTKWHHHFVCRICERVFDVPCLKGKKPCLKLSAPVGRADEAQVIFRGQCRSCQRKSGERRRIGGSPD